MTLLGYFWDRWPYFAGKLSWDVTTTQVNSALHPSRVAKSSTSFGWGKGRKVTSAGWQVTLCDPIWHVISRSGGVISITNSYIRAYFTYFLNIHSIYGHTQFISTTAAHIHSHVQDKWMTSYCLKGILHSKIALNFYSWPKSKYFWIMFTTNSISTDAIVT